jgi:pyruvate dehydrogenase (quinone)
MATTGADQMVETLAAAGVRRIYGIVGDSLNGFRGALSRHGGIASLHLRRGDEIVELARTNLRR